MQCVFQSRGICVLSNWDTSTGLWDQQCFRPDPEGIVSSSKTPCAFKQFARIPGMFTHYSKWIKNRWSVLTAIDKCCLFWWIEANYFQFSYHLYRWDLAVYNWNWCFCCSDFSDNKSEQSTSSVLFTSSHFSWERDICYYGSYSTMGFLRCW